MIERRYLSQPRGRVRLLAQTADTEAVEVEVLLKDPPPLVPPKVLVDVADADLSEVGGAPRRLALHLDAVLAGPSRAAACSNVFTRVHAPLLQAFEGAKPDTLVWMPSHTSATAVGTARSATAGS